MADQVDVTIIGGGPVGLFAAFYAGLRHMSVRIIDSLPELGGQLTALYPEKYVYDMPGFPKVLAKDLAREMAQQGTQFSPQIVLGDTAESLSEDMVIGTRSGLHLPTKTVIISAGAGAFSPTKIGLADEESWVGKGLHYGVRHLADFEGLRVAVIGGGDSAFDWALALSDVASEVHVVHRRDVFRAHEDTVEKVQALPVGFHLFKTVAAIQGEGRITGIEMEDTQTKERSVLACDTVVVNIGFKSSLGPLKDWGLTIEKNQIVVDHLYRTNRPGVFAVGDVCSFEGKLKLIATGVGEAATAVCIAKTMIEPEAKLFPGHSSDMNL
ncbi:MAG: NAD(P)/FAD-dependent oxidoreductase [Chthonomonas sp.]|nr:NAD(P)/FAD-dependent oxidoreductase [Chthonomonas sp.]